MAVAKRMLTPKGPTAKLLLLCLIIPRLVSADAFFCDHQTQTGILRASPEVVITSEGEGIQQGAEVSVRCNLETDGLAITLFAKDGEETEGLPVLRFAGKDQTLAFPTRPSHLGRVFLIPNEYEHQLVGLLRVSERFDLEIYAGNKGKKTYLFNSRKIPSLLNKLPCLN